LLKSAGPSHLLADVPYTFQDRVAAVESATRFQDLATTVLKEVEETTDALKTQVGAQARAVGKACMAELEAGWERPGARACLLNEVHVCRDLCWSIQR
jgi:hypothetical protein